MNPLEAERTRIQAELDAQRTRRQRNVMGQFATPGSLALEMLRSARDMVGERTSGLRFMDPAFGTGSFYSALLSVFDRESVAAAYGYEIDPHYGLPAARLWEPSGLRLDLTDFTACRPGDNGRERVDLLVCNPPYVRHHHIARATKLRLGRMVAEQLSVRVSGLAGLYVYFMLLSHRWLRPDSLSIWLIPSEFMDVNYGSALKEYLLSRVDLLRIHRFEPSEVQFEDALVSSAVVWFRNRAPSPGSAPEFTLGGSLGQSRLKRRLPRDELRRESKWTRFPAAGEASDVNGAVLGDFFAIKRGIATGANRFFIMDAHRADTLSIPSRFLRPVLPSPRYVKCDVVTADRDGVPNLERPLFVFDCHLPLDDLER
ncbi:MAG: SAM-dependent DNA methyltransferase, partial [Gemmatimonadetes bacterium]|nr:SAM-dependent DNA methyltransferase [Gemmatimonadota bacterium]